MAAQGGNGLLDPALARLGLLGRFDPECVLALMAVGKLAVPFQYPGPLVSGLPIAMDEARANSRACTK